MRFNTKQEIRDFLKSNGIFDLAKDKQLIAVVKLVSNIPWGDGRTIEDVLKIKKVGTCTGKHLVLQACFDEIGIDWRPIVCTFFWGEQDIKYPENLRAILSEGEWEHGHNFVQVKNNEGKWIDVDITWNPKLAPYGFKVLPDNWDEKSSFVAIDNIIKRWDGVDIETKKEELIESLTPELQRRREHFLKEFTKWINSINNQP